MLNNKELLDFISKNKFNTENAQQWVDFTKKLVEKFNLKTVIKEDGYTIVRNGEEKDIEHAYLLASGARKTLEQVFFYNVIYK